MFLKESQTPRSRSGVQKCFYPLKDIPIRYVCKYKYNCFKSSSWNLNAFLLYFRLQPNVLSKVHSARETWWLWTNKPKKVLCLAKLNNIWLWSCWIFLYSQSLAFAIIAMRTKSFPTDTVTAGVYSLFASQMKHILNFSTSFCTYVLKLMKGCASYGHKTYHWGSILNISPPVQIRVTSTSGKGNVHIFYSFKQKS